MSGPVTDLSLVILRISTLEFHNRLNEEQREMLRLYAMKSWAEGDILCFQVGAYRLDEINRKGDV